MKKIAAILLASALLISCKHSEERPVDLLAIEYMEKNHIPGLVWALVKDGEINRSGAYGMADMEKGIEMSIHGLMNVGSVTKTITATAIMQLWEQGKIDLDQDINLYLSRGIRNPRHPEVAITVQLLLTHTSSLIDGSAYYESYACGDPDLSLGEWMSSYFYEDGVFYNETENFSGTAPGEESYYSNVGYGLLGYIVEEVSGLSFSEYCSLNIFEPLGMKESNYYMAGNNISRHIIPYLFISKESREEIMEEYAIFLPGEKEFSPGENHALCLYSFPNIPDGLLRTSVAELSHFLSAYMDGGKYRQASILKKSTMDKMLSLQLEEDNSQGLCWHKSKFESLWGHGGSDPGISTQMFFSPDKKTGIIIFQNSNNGNITELMENIYSLETED